MALDAAEEANNNDDASAVNASPKAKTMKEVLLRCGHAFAVSMVIALAGKGFVGHAHNDPTGTDDVMMNVDLGIDSNSSKQVAILDGDGDGKNVVNYDFTKVDGGVSTVRTLQGPNPTNKPTTSYTFTKFGDGECRDGNNNKFDDIYFQYGADADACRAKCEECRGQGQAAKRELRGFYYDFLVFLGPRCFCYLDKGDPFLMSDCPGASGVITASTGTGAICTVGFGNGECWKVVDSTLQCPTPAPTNKPTTLAPTNKPTTLAPTNKPTTGSPTSPPTNSKATKVAKKVNSNMQVQEMKSGGSSFSISRPLVGIFLALIAFSNLLL